MADYSRYKTATLEKMREVAWRKYKAEAEKPGEGWGAGMRKARLCDYKTWERAKERYEAICSELKKREVEAHGG